jgi:carboxyl-terminal processing protease
MRRTLRSLRACAAACLLIAGGASLAAAQELAETPFASLQAAYARAVTPGEQADMYRELFPTVFERVQRSYASEVDLPALVATALQVLEPLPPGAGDPGEVFKKAMNEALRTLDPYSRYLDPRSHSQQRGDASGSFSGLGLEVEAGEDGVRVLAPMPGSPAARAGLQRGDLIVRVDDQPLVGVPLADAIARMRGPAGSPVTIALRRTGADHEITVSLTRDVIRRQAVRWSMEGEVLVLALTSFTGPVSAALAQAIAEATVSGLPRAVVLDLRGNPGGLLREAVLTADTFLRAGDIASIRGRTPGNQRSWQADAAELLPGLPMVVLIDGRSASASELVAAALQDNGRAKVMGQRSFGKGTVQSTYPLGQDRGALKLTTSFYHAPSGRAVQKIGVSPDIELVSAAAGEGENGEAMRPRTVAEKGAAPEQTVRVEQARCAAKRKAADPALSCAIAFLLAGTVEALSE